ncbi:MAG: AmmeMemoRadiSam system radical SAM enzyme [Sulfolobales archaeon]|nr:AmmeMemoRadiSam system radical SAM enzyme [Sulfolobales archaeon]MCX8199424.1 AmmeMemoRadiSam system radical SAM enzyme [Sulfolobales archaeon]
METQVKQPWMRESRFYKAMEEKTVQCTICERKCILKPGWRGVCWNHMNIDGRLYNNAYGLLSALESRPIEIKPLFHYHPNSTALTFSGYGCNYRCPWCQNHFLSQVPPLPEASIYIEPKDLVKEAMYRGDEGLSASFNEPTIHFEYILDVASEARRRNLYFNLVTNGYMSLSAIDELTSLNIDGYSIDIKGCPESYRNFLGANPLIVFRNAKYIVERGGHVEMVFLIVTGANDSPECIKWVLKQHADTLGPDVPIHINRYYPAHKYSKPPTRIDVLINAYNLAKEMGINYVYVGNIPSEEYQDTKCPKCGKVVIVRRSYRVTLWNLTSDGRCPKCSHKIPIVGKYYPSKRSYSLI